MCIACLAFVLGWQILRPIGRNEVPELCHGLTIRYKTEIHSKLKHIQVKVTDCDNI